MDKKQLKGQLCALIANIIFGFSYLFITVALDGGVDPLIIVSIRFTVSFLVMSALILLKIVKVSYKGKKLLKLFIMALAQPLLYFLFETYGLAEVSSSVSGVIISLVPAAVMLGYILIYKGKPTLKQIIFSVVSVAGVIALTLISSADENAKFSIKGVILLLLAVLSSAVFNMLSNKESDKFSPIEKTYAMFTVGFIGFNIISVASLRGNIIEEYSKAFSDPKVFFAIMFLSLVASVIANLTYNYATSNIDMVKASSFSSIIPICSFVAGIFILNEPVSLPLCLSVAAVILGVYMINTSKTDKNDKSKIE